MTIILNPMMINHETKFERLTRQVERIDRIVDYDKGDHQSLGVNPKDLGNNPRDMNDNMNLNGNVSYVVRHDQNVDVLDIICVNQRGKRYQVTRIVEDVLNRVVSYIEMGYLSKESDFEFSEVKLDELKKGSPYVCSSLKKVANIDKFNDVRYKSGRKYNFDISKSEQIFDVLFKDKQLILLEDKILLSIKDLKERPYFKFHQATSHSTNNCVRFIDLIQEAIMEGRLKCDDGKKRDEVLGDFEGNVWQVYPGIVIFEKERMKKELAHKEEQVH
ncbi:hypothetical protein Ahy_A02g009976 [Arachis hypogaea]|uniref:Uncharacterized protein n=1 Tax=Arachis hypogaea TaxID=3818 RepID=A0A445EIZ6_ARAHY|nr:hypothetical protein Ahy_A02g009976 [Arachis hypogaea]